MEQPSLREQVVRARRGLIIFLALVVLISAPLLWVIIRSGVPAEQQILLVLALMWVPALSSVIARLILHEGPRDVSFRFGGKKGLKAIAVTVAFPAVVGLLAYGTAWAVGLADFGAPAGGLFPGVDPPLLRFVVRLLFAATAGAVIGVISAAGEEIGWRGYMLARLVKAKIPRPMLVSGIVWGLYHVPGILSGQYATGPSRWISLIIFMIVAIGLSVLWGQLRLSTGSVWPAILGHSSWNAVIQGPFTSFTLGAASQGASVALWIGESGILVAIAVVLVTALIVRADPDIVWNKQRLPLRPTFE